MSIPTSLTRLATAKADLKAAINAKGGTLTDELISEYADAVDALTPETFGNRVRFFDFDGTILKTQYVATGAAATAPTVPTHDRMTFQAWNNAFNNVQGDLDVGAVYTTTTGNTEIDIHLTVKTGKVQTFNIFLSSGTMIVDWGDGETSSVNNAQSSQAVSHTYADYGDYTVELELSEGGEWYPYQYFCGDNNYTMIAIRLTGVTNMATYAFSNQQALRTISMANGVSTISSRAFSGSRSLIYVIIPSTIATIADYTFRECYSLAGFVWPSTVNTIPQYAFYCCQKLLDCVIPNGVTAVLEYAFSDDYGLKHTRLPSTLTTIAARAFQNCYALAEVNIPDGVTSIGEYAFYRCYALREITLPPTLSTIERGVFYYDYGLQSVNWSDSITVIRDSAFGYCNLKDIAFPESLVTIESSAFAYNYRLKKIDFPASVTSIGDGAFYECYGIVEYVLNRNTPPTLQGTGAFSSINKGCLFKIPASEGLTVLNAYQTASNWSYYADYMIEKEA